VFDNRKTWFLDFDGTLVAQKSYHGDVDEILPTTIDFFNTIIKNDDFVIITTGREEANHKKRIEGFMKKFNLRYDLIICNLPTGPRIVINDTKPDGSITAYSYSIQRDKGINLEEINI